MHVINFTSLLVIMNSKEAKSTLERRRIPMLTIFGISRPSLYQCMQARVSRAGRYDV